MVLVVNGMFMLMICDDICPWSMWAVWKLDEIRIKMVPRCGWMRVVFQWSQAEHWWLPEEHIFTSQDDPLKDQSWIININSSFNNHWHSLVTCSWENWRLWCPRRLAWYIKTSPTWLNILNFASSITWLAYFEVGCSRMFRWSWCLTARLD